MLTHSVRVTRADAGAPSSPTFLPALLLGAGLAVLVVALIVDRLVWNLTPMGDKVPDLTLRGGVRVLAMAVAVALCVAGLLRFAYRLQPPGVRLDPQLLPTSALARIGLAAVFAGGAFFAFLLAVSPAGFHRWAREDSLAEWLTAALLFLGFVSCALLAWHRWRRLGSLDIVTAAIGMLAVLHFVMAGEEISWFQRVFDIPTPEAFRGNAQQEMNLHNFATRWVELAFYVCAGFVLPLLIPLWLHLRLPLGPLKALLPLAPPPWLIGPAAVIAAYNVNRWNWLPTQLQFWACAAVLGAMALGAARRGVRVQALVLLGSMATLQIAFLAAGSRQLRGWDVTEYKELLIAAVLFMYCIALWRQAALPAGSPASGDR